jgi:hypothetical protein
MKTHYQIENVNGTWRVRATATEAECAANFEDQSVTMKTSRIHIQ